MIPPGPVLTRAIAQTPGVLNHVSGDHKRFLGVHSQNLFHTRHFVATQGGTVNLAGVLLSGRWPTNDGLDGDERGLSGLFLRGGNRRHDRVDVLRVVILGAEIYGVHIPAIGLITCRYVFGKGNVGLTFDGNLIGVIEHDEVAQFLMPS